ncbi:MAG: hypothetical protein FWF59_10105 [Turicibacter sp.]|nr:hypothetical protein [Turicibacter sp.]
MDKKLKKLLTVLMLFTLALVGMATYENWSGSWTMRTVRLSDGQGQILLASSRGGHVYELRPGWYEINVYRYHFGELADTATVNLDLRGNTGPETFINRMTNQWSEDEESWTNYLSMRLAGSDLELMSFEDHSDSVGWAPMIERVRLEPGVETTFQFNSFSSRHYTATDGHIRNTREWTEFLDFLESYEHAVIFTITAR